jgi:alanine-synthesizing transaminase
MGWEVPKPGGTMFVWAPIPEAYSEMNSVEFCSMLVKECDVALSPGVGFGPGGEGYVRFALIENEQRIAQAMRNLRRGLTKLG